MKHGIFDRFRREALRLATGLLLLPAATSVGLGAEPAPVVEDHQFRVAFSHSFFGGVTDVDATAAIVAWQETILKPAGIPFNPHPMICAGLPDMVAALKRGEIDAVALQFSEYAAVPAGLLDSAFVYVNERRGGAYEQYVLLVPQASDIREVRQLRGRRLIRWDHPRSCLAISWLDRLLAEEGQEPSATFFGAQTKEAKPAKAILPVFFGRADACLVTRATFLDMSELNPQVGQRLRVLAASADLIPSFLCFRRGYASRFRAQVEAAIQNLHTSTAGKQVLMIFGCDQITQRPGSCLQTAWELAEPSPRRPARSVTAAEKAVSR